MKNLVKGVLLVILALPQVSFDCLSQDKETVSMNLDRFKERLGVRFVYDSELGKLLDKNYEGTSVEGLTLEKALADFWKERESSGRFVAGMWFWHVTFRPRNIIRFVGMSRTRRRGRR